MVLNSFLEISQVSHAFQGIKLAIGILILDAALKMIAKMPKKALPRTIMLCSFAAMLVIDFYALHISSIMLMLAAGFITLILFTVSNVSKKEILK